VSVNDVTSRVLLARELKDSQANAQVQMDMLLGLLQLEPHQLTSFLDESSASLGHVNSVLKVPARSDREFRDKIDKLFREMHRIKGEASALGLVTVESRAHGFEDLLSSLRDRKELTGSDFLPLVVRLDEILGHLQSIRDLAGRVDELRADALLSTPSAAQTPPPAPLEQDISGSLDTLANRIAADRGKQVRLVTAGLDDVPGDYRKALRDIVIQLIRNAVVHGIETPDARRSLGKDATGQLQVQFKPREQGFELVFQDDGAGIVADRVREAALRRGTISADEAQSLDTKSTLALIFRSGFSTHDGSDRDAGRGVGLDFVLKCAQSLGGKVGVATAPGKYTRFCIVLPAETLQQGAVA
jgi:chemotaxis protein histidine kinase CheA